MQGDALVGATIGPYRIVELIGKGGMATVYKASQPALNRHVAIKFLSGPLADDPTATERFRREALAVARLEHPNILAIYDVGEHDGLHYIVMPLVTQGTVRARMSAPLPLDWTVWICSQVADALDHAHALGIVHRDVKPSNILIAPGERALLCDFGIARLLDQPSGLTETGTGLGSPDYISPEQACGLPADGRSDQYALAVTVFEMLAGSAPYTGATPLSVAYQHINEPIPSLCARVPSLPTRVDEAIQKAMAKVPEDRFPSAGEFAQALSEATTGPVPLESDAGATLASTSRRSLSNRLGQPRRTLVALAGFLLFMAGALALYAALPFPSGSTTGGPALPTAALLSDELDLGAPPSPGNNPQPAPAQDLARDQLSIQINDIGCTGASGRVSAQGQPVRNYVVSSIVRRAGTNTSRPLVMGQTVAGLEFQIQYNRLPPGAHEVLISARRAGTRLAEPVISTVDC